MAGAHDPTTSMPESSSSSGGGDSNEIGDFECNICFDLARDPVITLCGHLYCWPCLYMWLRDHSQAQDCPVCKALVVEEKVIPLYGRGKSPVDPRSKPIPGIEIPNRPSGQRPETAPRPADDTNLANVLMGFMGGFVPIASATFSNFGMAANFGGVFSPFFSVQYGFTDPRGYGASTGYHQNGYPGPFHDGERRTNRERTQAMQADDENLTKILLVIFILVVLTFLSM